MRVGPLAIHWRLAELYNDDGETAAVESYPS
jgi:hypothetical protein